MILTQHSLKVDFFNILNTKNKLYIKRINVKEAGHGHVQRRDNGYIRKRMVNMKLPGRKARLMDVKNDLWMVGVTEMNARDRVRWR